MECHTCHEKGQFPLTVAWETDAGPEGGGGGGGGGGRDTGSREFAISPRMCRRECGQFLGRYPVSDPGGSSLEEMEAAGERTAETLGLTVFSGGRALKCMGQARLAVTLGTRTVLWDFIVTKIGEDKGILGNDFAMAHRLTEETVPSVSFLYRQEVLDPQ